MHYALYFDDIVTWKTARNFIHLQKSIQTCQDYVDKWFLKCGFKPSSSKTIAVTFSLSNKKKLSVKLTLNKAQITVRYKFKFLGTNKIR